MIHLLILLFPLFYYGRAQQTLYPPALPLTVRSPYLSCWMFTLNGTNIADQWSTTSAHQPSSQDSNSNVCHFCAARHNTRIDCTLEPKHASSCPCRQYNLLIAGRSVSHQRNLEPHQHGNFTYPDPAHRRSRAHAIQPYLSEPDRGSNWGCLCYIILTFDIA